MATDPRWHPKPPLTYKSPRKIRPYPIRRPPHVIGRTRGALRRGVTRLSRPRRHARTPHGTRTRLDYAASLEAMAAQNVRGSLQERIVYKSLIDHGLREPFDFTFQSSMLGGRMELGGLVADFIFEIPRVVIQVQSLWHSLSLEYKVRDQDQAAVLQSMGYTVFEIWPDTIESPEAMRLWMQRHIMHLWGTSDNALGQSHGRDIPFLMGIWSSIEDDIHQFLLLLIEIKEILWGEIKHPSYTDIMPAPSPIIDEET